MAYNYATIIPHGVTHVKGGGSVTIKRLEQFAKLKKEIARVNQRITNLRCTKAEIVYDVVKGSSRKPPYKERLITIKGFGEKQAALIHELEQRQADNMIKLYDDLLAIEAFISTVEDSGIRQVIRYHYIDGLTWEETARKVYGRSSGDRARINIKRFFDKGEKA